MNDKTYITWQFLSLGLLSLLQVIVLGVAAWLVKSILEVKEKVGKNAGRVAHIERHLESNPISKAEFKPL